MFGFSKPLKPFVDTDYWKWLSVINRVTVISVNFKTPQLILDCARSLREFYPGIFHIILDNGGCRESTVAITGLSEKPYITMVKNKENVGHGPALHRGILLSGTPYVFLLDSDTRVTRHGFIEEMLSQFDANDDLFAIGWLRYVNENGVASPHQELKRGMPYVHPYACMLDREKYLGLEPFAHTGAPAINLMRSAIKRGYKLMDFPIQEYIWHKIAGTRGHFGGRCKIPTDTPKKKWRKCRI